MKTIEITSSEQKQSYRKKIKQLKIVGLNTSKYLGKISIPEEPMQVQKRLRDEWK